MKLGGMGIIVSNKKGDCYQVVLSKQTELAVMNVIEQLEGGIKVMKQKLPIDLLPKKASHKMHKEL